MSKTKFLLSLVTGGMLLFSTSAHAILQFSADINGTIFSCQDNAACDLNPAVGTVQTGPLNIGSVVFLGSAQTQTTGPFNSLDTTSFQVTNNGASTATIQIAVGGTGFVGPVTTLSESGSGTFQNAIGSNIDLSYFADHANTQGANTPINFPGVLQADSGVLTATLLTDSFNFNHTSSFINAGLYSMELGTTGTLVAGGQLTGRSQAIVAEQVPEPASLLLLGVSLVGFGAIMHRRRKIGDLAA